jgi:hypothetical protein
MWEMKERDASGRGGVGALGRLVAQAPYALHLSSPPPPPPPARLPKQQRAWRHLSFHAHAQERVPTEGNVHGPDAPAGLYFETWRIR